MKFQNILSAVFAVTGLLLLAGTESSPAQSLSGPSGQRDVTPILGPGIDLESLQDAWQKNPEKSLGPDQIAPGYRQCLYVWNEICQAQMRIGFTTLFHLDPSERIYKAVVGDSAAFQITLDENFPYLAEVKALRVGVDTTMQIYTTTGRIYLFVVASHSVEHSKTTDIRVDVLLANRPQDQRPSWRGWGPHPDPEKQDFSLPGSLPQAGETGSGSVQNSGDIQEFIQRSQLNRIPTEPVPEIPVPATVYSQNYAPETPKIQEIPTKIQETPNFPEPDPVLELQDFLAQFGLGPNANLLDRPGSLLEQRFFGNLEGFALDPSKIQFDYTVTASSEQAALALAPIRVIRDNRWTFIDFGKNSLHRGLPVATIVDDRTERPVHYEFSDEGRYMVIHEIGNIVLRRGQHVICLKIPQDTRTEVAEGHLDAGRVVLIEPNTQNTQNTQEESLVQPFQPQIEVPLQNPVQNPARNQRIPIQTRTGSRAEISLISPAPAVQPVQESTPVAPIARSGLGLSGITADRLREILWEAEYHSVSSDGGDPPTFQIEGLASRQIGSVCQLATRSGGQCWLTR